MKTKPRGDSKLDALTPEQKTQLAEWLTVENLTYPKAKARVLEKFGVSTTASALCSFFSRYAAPWSYAQAAGDAESFASLISGQIEPAALKRATQLAFSALTNRKPDIKAAKALFKIVGDSAKLKLATDRLALDADKFRQDVKSDAEKGLDALHLELKGDAVALALFEQMRARVMATLEAKPA